MATGSIVEYRRRVFDYYNEERFRDALAAAREAAKRFPDYDAKTSFWIACLESRLGNSEAAIHVLQSAVKRGIWWPERVFRDPDLESISSRSEFEQVKTECVRLKREQPNRLTPELMVRTPSNYPEGRNWPALIMFHERYGERPELSAQPWSSVVSNGMLLVALWSSQVYCSDGRCWDDLESAVEDVRWAVSQIRANYHVDPSKIAVGGFSQGGGLAIYSTLKQVIPTCGFVAVSPSDWIVPEKAAVERNQPSEAFSSLVESVGCGGRRGAIIIGDRDPFFAKIDRLYSIMVERGLYGRLSVEKGLGHEYPRDFESKLKASVDLVFGDA